MYYFTVSSLAAPVNIRFPPQSITDVSFVVQWDAVINQSVDRYIISVYRTDNENPVQTVTVNETSYTVTGLTPNTTYTVTVTAVDEHDCIEIASAVEEVTTNISETIYTIGVSGSPSVDRSVTTTTIDNSVANNATNNYVTKPVPTLDVTIMSIATLIPTVIPTNRVHITSKLMTITIIKTNSYIATVSCRIFGTKFT